jgi:RNA polymerase sigma-70 factor (ECF subfamily)
MEAIAVNTFQTGGRAHPAEPATERAVIEQVLAGDPEPFAWIMRRYQRLVSSVAYRMRVSPSAVDDVVSEVFIKVYTRLGQYEGRYPLSSWIYRIATNHVLDEIRSRDRAPCVGLDDVAELRDPRVDTATATVLSERDLIVRRAIVDLPEDYSRVLMLRHFDELSIETIAGLLGIPEGTVKIRLMRGRLRLRRLLERRYPGQFGAACARVGAAREARFSRRLEDLGPMTLGDRHVLQDVGRAPPEDLETARADSQAMLVVPFRGELEAEIRRRRMRDGIDDDASQPDQPTDSFVVTGHGQIPAILQKVVFAFELRGRSADRFQQHGHQLGIRVHEP